MNKSKFMTKRKISTPIKKVYRAKGAKVLDLVQIRKQRRTVVLGSLETFFDFTLNYGTISTSIELKLLFFFQVWHQTFGRITLFEHLREIGYFGTKNQIPEQK